MNQIEIYEHVNIYLVCVVCVSKGEHRLAICAGSERP